MKRTRRNFSATFKAKVAIEALKERQSLSELASAFDIHPNQLTAWKKQFLDNADVAFGQEGKHDELQKTREQLDELYKQIGQMKVETDWLKKKLL
jgi:transposase